MIPVEAAHYSGFYIDWWRHPHANAAQVCGRVFGFSNPQSPDMDRWLTWHYYTQDQRLLKETFILFS